MIMALALNCRKCGKREIYQTGESYTGLIRFIGKVGWVRRMSTGRMQWFCPECRGRSLQGDEYVSTGRDACSQSTSHPAQAPTQEIGASGTETVAEVKRTTPKQTVECDQG